MKVTNRSGLPPHVAKVLEAAFRNNAYDGPRGNRIITVTQLVGPPQKLQLERANEADLEVDVLDTVPALEGSAIHHLLELAGKDAPELIPEQRLQVQHAGWTISGKADLYLTSDRVITDWKRGSVWSFIYSKPDWEAQLNVYAWLFHRNGFPVSGLQIILFPGDWRRSEARQMEDYPKRVQAMPVLLWGDEKTTAYVDERLRLHASDLPPCSAEERWQKPDTYACKKDGNKKARRVWKTKTEAEADVKGGEIIEFRRGQSVRCLDYCLVGGKTAFCRQWLSDPTNPANQPKEADE